jgi:hypothetical protein
MVRFIGLLALVAFPLRAVSAQQANLPAGTRVRLSHTPGKALTGTVVGQRADTLVLKADRDGENVLVPLNTIERLQVGQRVHSRRSALGGSTAGLLLGATGGLLVGPLVTSRGCRSPEKTPTNLANCAIAMMDGDVRLKATVVGGIGGALVGAIVGMLSTVDRWEDATPQKIRPLVSLRGTSVGVGFSLRF